MTTFGIRDPLVSDEQQQRNNEDLLQAINALGKFIYSGTGAPTLTPSAGRAIYIRIDGGAGTTLYVWEGAAWVGK